MPRRVARNLVHYPDELDELDGILGVSRGGARLAGRLVHHPDERGWGRRAPAQSRSGTRKSSGRFATPVRNSCEFGYLRDAAREAAKIHAGAASITAGDLVQYISAARFGGDWECRKRRIGILNHVPVDRHRLEDRGPRIFGTSSPTEAEEK